MLIRLLLASLLTVLVFPTRAEAATCTVTMSALNFGSADTLKGYIEATADISIECENVGPVSSVTVCGNIGPIQGRQMNSGNASLHFDLFADPGHSIPWGHVNNPGLGSPQRIVLPVRGTSASAKVTLYGLVPGRQTGARVGNYAVRADAAFYYAEGETLQCDAPGH